MWVKKKAFKTEHMCEAFNSSKQRDRSSTKKTIWDDFLVAHLILKTLFNPSGAFTISLSCIGIFHNHQHIMICKPSSIIETDIPFLTGNNLIWPHKLDIFFVGQSKVWTLRNCISSKS